MDGKIYPPNSLIFSNDDPCLSFFHAGKLNAFRAGKIIQRHEHLLFLVTLKSFRSAFNYFVVKKNKNMNERKKEVNDVRETKINSI